MAKVVIGTALCVVAVVCLVEGSLMWLRAAESKPATSGPTVAPHVPGAAAASGQDRLREGSSISDQVGYFKLTGDRLTFYSPDGKVRLGGLENLNLERIAKIVGESTETLEWTVSGTVTEYQGANFLLISRAVLKTKLNRRSTPGKN